MAEGRKKDGKFDKGNKIAEGCLTSGCPPKYDLVEEARKLDEWSKTEDATSLYRFTYDKDYLATDLSKWADINPVFKQSLAKAKERIAIKREEHCNKQKMQQIVWARNVHTYDTMLHASEENKEHRKEQREFDRKKDLIKYENDLKTSGADENSQTVQAYNNMMAQLSSMQAERPGADLNKDVSNKINANRS